MTEPESNPESRLPVDPELPQPGKTSRLRRFFLRHLPLSLAAAGVLLAFAVAGLYFWASSAHFEDLVRKRIVALIEDATGGRVEIASFHWHLLDLEANAGGLVIHGNEAPSEAPYAEIEQLRVRLSIVGLLSPRILLREADVVRPAFHLIVYEDGSTNQPQPRKAHRPGRSALDTFFDLQASRVSVQQGLLHYDNRAAAFDLQNRWVPLDFDAGDVSLQITYVPASLHRPEGYHIEAGAADLNMARGKAGPTNGLMQATLDLTRFTASLQSLRITSKTKAASHSWLGKSTEDHTVEFSGTLEDFAHPRWQGKATGELDMKAMNPVFGYPSTPQGIAHLDLSGAGDEGEFRIDGGVQVNGGAYVQPGVNASGVRLDAHVHADPEQLVVTSIVARLRQGGEIHGEIRLTPWLSALPGGAALQRGGMRILRAAPGQNPASTPAGPVHPPPPFIPINGKVTAQFANVSLDTVLDIVGQGPFQRLGLDTHLSGPATATWTGGDVRTLVVDAKFSLAPSTAQVKNEAPASGAVDATYAQRDGAVDLRKLEVNTPASRLEAHGHLGAFPLTSSSSLAVAFHSHNLGEFDAVLRDLGLKRNGVSGTAALPVALSGQLDFLSGTWTGSLVHPHIAGDLKATNLGIEMPIIPSGKPGQAPTSRLVEFDSTKATGSYSPERISIGNAMLLRGKTQIDLHGTLDAAPGRVPAYDARSVLHMHLNAGDVGLDDVQTLIGQDLPLTGKIGAQIQVDGPVQALDGIGWISLADGSAYGEPFTRINAQGAVTNGLVKVNLLAVTAPAGNFSGNGSYDLKARRFQVDARGSGIDIASIKRLPIQGSPVKAKLGFSLTGSGTLDDPLLEIHASLRPLVLAGEPLGGVDLVAHTYDQSVTYNATTRLEGAEVNLHGVTALTGDNDTQAELVFSHFNIDSLLKAAHVQGLSGKSALAGTVTVQGPLAHPDQLRGEARLDQLAVTIAGVHLANQGDVHATLANARINLEPLHVTGEETDLHVQGSLALKDKQQLDLAANGSINLKLAETVDPDITAAGTTTFQVQAHGPLKDPSLQGRIDFQNGSLSLEDIPNGLSQLHGTLEFNQNRLEVRSLTAMSGGGLLSVAGYLAYQHGIYADLSVTGKGIRIRYPPGVSSLADATLHLQGAQSNLSLGGDVLVTRFSVSPDLDIAALAAQAGAVQTIAPPDAPSNHIRLDIHIVSSPQLNFQNAFAKVAGNVDLQLRGTVASPSLLGRVSITEGSATIAGTRYDLQRGDIFFTNPVRIEPSIDLNATARVEDYDITLGLHGTVNNPAITWRSDPPLPEADVVALLALGRTGNQQRLYTQQQEQSLANPTTDALLGGALNATVSSRVQKLFGAGSVKVDPNYLGALGNSTSRIIVEEQMGRHLTLTYATNVNTTSQQLIQAEVSINRQFSLLVARDESGVFSMVVKATRRYR
jgi:translocation and assembly module TamB